ncbi:hypothetical protein [Mumia quercus]|uniref:hypothetical protein n=1 Tax=Mumia quercus TaxID=2976125 RepID=UPI0021D07E1A|nr:hypothetical protein [Mumia quercus]
MRESVANRPVLVVGLDPFRVPGPWDPTPVAEAIEAGMAELAERGYDAESCLVALDGSEDIEAHVRRSLVARAWACVVIGGGIRRDEDRLGLFEWVVNLVRRLAPGAAIAFNRTPRDLAEAVARGLQGGADG